MTINKQKKLYRFVASFSHKKENKSGGYKGPPWLKFEHA